ncbi:uncharacterized protein [Temnothorax nylanderi]|uniref:uncharacterized protein n=1 Tax=Temnothorax nylanderi TaxID=102681 RepID=UPI003A899A17
MEKINNLKESHEEDDYFSNESEDLNAMDMLTSNEMLDNVQMYDSTVEVVGYVDGIDAPRYVGDKSQYKVFKFYLNNGSGKRVQIVAWNDDVDVVEQYIVQSLCTKKRIIKDIILTQDLSFGGCWGAQEKLNLKFSTSVFRLLFLRE